MMLATEVDCEIYRLTRSAGTDYLDILQTSIDGMPGLGIHIELTVYARLL